MEYSGLLAAKTRSTHHGKKWKKGQTSSLGGGGCAARHGAIYQENYPERVILER